MLIELQHATQPEHDLTASFKAQQSEADSAADSAQDAAVPVVGMVSAAAKQMLQTLAKQHSCKCQPIFSSTHIQQLLQPCLHAFCQPEAARLRGCAPAVKCSAPAAKGSASDIEGTVPAVKGNVLAVQASVFDAKDSAAVVEGSPVEGTKLSSERQCLPTNVQTVNGHCDADDMSAHDWQMLRYRREDRLQGSKCADIHIQACAFACMQRNPHNVCSRQVQNLMYSFLMYKQCLMVR